MSHAGGLREHWGGDDGEFLATARALVAFGDEVPDLTPRQAAARADTLELPGLEQLFEGAAPASQNPHMEWDEYLDVLNHY